MVKSTETSCFCFAQHFVFCSTLHDPLCPRMTFFMITFDLHAMGGISRMDTFSITPYPSVFRFWCLVRYVCSAIYMYRTSQKKWRPDILVLMLKNIHTLLIFACTLNLLKLRFWRWVILVRIIWRQYHRISHFHFLEIATDSLCPVTHCAPSSPTISFSNTHFRRENALFF
jgi:hypothetical protein